MPPRDTFLSLVYYERTIVLSVLRGRPRGCLFFYAKIHKLPHSANFLRTFLNIKNTKIPHKPMPTGFDNKLYIIVLL